MPESLISDRTTLTTILGRVLVVVAHPDDESIGCGVLLQRAAEAMVVFVTDGAPHHQKFWHGCRSRAEYAGIRRKEALAAAASIGVKRTHFLNVADQKLFRNLSRALAELGAILTEFKPDAVVTHAYEGGHPDHDACAFLVSLLSQKCRVPAWEMPLYHRSTSDRTIQKFISPISSSQKAEELVLNAAGEELERKRTMIARYTSQEDFVQSFDIAREIFRPQTTYDFTRPPHAGLLNYEEWQWPMTGGELSQAFRAMLSEQKAHAQGR